MTIEELTHHLAVYGCHWSRWPDPLRVEAQVLVIGSPEARLVYEAEQRLDHALDLVQPDPAGVILKESLVNQATRLPQIPFDTPVVRPLLWYHTSMAKVAMFTGLFLIGVAIGANESILQPAFLPDQELGALLRESLFAQEWIP